jgi:hypothetical protein
MAIWLLMSNRQDVQLLIYGLLIHYAFWLWASYFYMWNDICYGSNPPPVLWLYTMPVVQIVRRNLVPVSLTSYYISHAGKTGTLYRLAYDFMHNICFYMRLNGYTGSVNCLQILYSHSTPASRLNFSFALKRLASLQGETLGPIWHMEYLFVQECWYYMHLPATLKWPVHCTFNES